MTINFTVPSKAVITAKMQEVAKNPDSVNARHLVSALASEAGQTVGPATMAAAISKYSQKTDFTKAVLQSLLLAMGCDSAFIPEVYRELEFS